MASAVRKYGEKAFTQELRLTSNDDGGRFDYVLGAYYQDQDRFATPTSYLRGFKHWWDTAFPAFAAAVISDVDFDSRQDENFTGTAAYAQLTSPATHHLPLTDGFRHFPHAASTPAKPTTRPSTPPVPNPPQ